MTENVEAERDTIVEDPQGDAALAIAQKIGNAIVKKFPKHTLFVRKHSLGDTGGFVELALRPDGGGYNQEIHTSYSYQYFTQAVGEQLNVRAKRIYSDFKIHFGIKD